jgi:NADH-quinone oxidoreductase subunit A
METFVALLMMAGVVFGALAFTLVLNRWLAPRLNQVAASKREAFECGNTSPDPGERRRYFGFYLLAIDFVLFDVEIAFLYPWAVTFGQLEGQTLIFVSVFLLILVTGFIYAWKSGAIQLE